HLTAYPGGSDAVSDLFNTLGASVPGIEGGETGPIGAYRTLGWTRTQASPDTRHLVYLTDFRGNNLTDYVGLSTLTSNDAFWVSLDGMPKNMSVQAWLYKSVPEPETYALLIIGGLAVYLGRRRRVTSPRVS